MATCQLQVRADSIDLESRSFRAVMTTDAPVTVFDMAQWRMIDEILVADGGRFGDHMPLLWNHRREEADDVAGSAVDFVRVANGWEGRAIVAEPSGEGDPVERIWSRIVGRHIRAVSIGYRVDPKSAVEISPGKSETVAGREYTAGDLPLRVAQQWTGRELSVTPIGADASALIRSQQRAAKPQFRSMFR